MVAAAIDTHEVVKDLQAAGFTDKQAEAMARLMRQAQDIDLSSIATKTDLSNAKFELVSKIAEAKADSLKWVVGAIGAQTLVLIGVLVTLAKVVH